MSARQNFQRVCLASTVAVALAGCADLKQGGGAGGGSVAADAASCVAALIPTGLVSGVGALTSAALSTPACTKLTKDLLDFALREATQSVAKARAMMPSSAVRRVQ